MVTGLGGWTLVACYACLDNALLTDSRTPLYGWRPPSAFRPSLGGGGRPRRSTGSPTIRSASSRPGRAASLAPLVDGLQHGAEAAVAFIQPCLNLRVAEPDAPVDLVAGQVTGLPGV